MAATIMFLFVSSTVTWLSKRDIAALYCRRASSLSAPMPLTLVGMVGSVGAAYVVVDIVAYNNAFMTSPMCPLFPPPSIVGTFAAFA
eukprot:11891273-Ditylum_brightwellii.AAC.1